MPLLAAFFVATAMWAKEGGDTYFVRGIVRDSVTDAPVAHASVIVSGMKGSTVADGSGIFEFSVPAAAKSLQVNCVGYNKKIVPLKRNSLNMYVVYLSPSVTELKEVVVHKSKYSKRNNPAIDFLEKIKRAAPENDPMQRPYYSYDQYERISVGLNDFDASSVQPDSRFGFLREHVDTSEISGKPYLSLIVKEKRSKVHHRSSPERLVEIVEATRQSGIDEAVDQESMRTFLEDVMRPTNLYDRDINLLQNRFVSPLSPIAPDFYRFYLTDTVDTGDEKCVVLSFYPRNKASFGFNGHIYVPAGDSTMFVRRVEMRVPQDINLNFVDNLYISQDFERGPDGTAFKTSDILALELSYAGKGQIYAYKATSYDNHRFDAVADSVFSSPAAIVVEQGAEGRDLAYWHQARPDSLAGGESRLDELVHRLRRVPVYYWGEKIVKILFSGYVATGSPSKFDIGPVNSFLSFNSIEKVRLKAGGMTTAQLSPRWFGRFYVARGFHDHRWKYGAEAELSFVDKKLHSREFPMRSVMLFSQYDLVYPGEEYRYTSVDNIVLSLKRMSDDRALYRRLNRITFNWEIPANLSLSLSVANERLTPAPTMTLLKGDGSLMPSLTANKADIEVRYAPGEKFFQTRTHRFPVNMDAFSLTLRHTIAPRGLWGTDYGINKTEFQVAKRWWMSAFGYVDTYFSGGHVWGETDYLSLFTPDVNLSYTIQPASFALLNPLEFICSSYAMWDITYWANGALLNCIPGVKKLQLRETVGFKGYWGTLANSSNPALHPSLIQFPTDAGVVKLDHGPYMELSAGLDNIFKVLRLEYVWRLNYTRVPYSIDRSGLRLAVHVTF